MVLKLKLPTPSRDHNILKCISTELTFICSKSTIETLEKGVFIVNFQHILHLFLVFLLLTLSNYM